MTRPAGTSTTPEVPVLDVIQCAAVLLILGLTLVVAAIYGLAGLWWALFAGGILLAALAVLLARGPRRSTSNDDASDPDPASAP